MLLTAPTSAQDPVVVSSDDGTIVSDGVIVLQEIVVTGEKVARDQSETYSSVGVVTSEEIDDLPIDDLNQALNLIANVRALPSGQGNANISIRGLNAEGVTQPSARSSPIVQVSVDGAIQGVEATRRGSRGIWDVEQIEVYRGPQSTLQGPNALGGAVIINTKDPVYTPELILEGEAGNNDYLSGAVVANVPVIADQVAVRVAAQSFKKTKDIDFVDPRFASLGEEEFQEIRGKLLVTPAALPGLRAVFSISHTHDKPGWDAVTGPDFFARVYDDPTGTAAELRDTNVNRYVADIEYTFLEHFTLSSLSSFVDTRVSIRSPEGSTFARGDTRDIHTFAQDVNIAYENPDVPLSGLFGIYGSYQRNDTSSHITADTVPGLGLPTSAVFGLPNVTVQDLEGRFTNSTIAAYGEARYTLFDRLTLIGGGRVLYEEVGSKLTGQALDFDQTAVNIGTCQAIGCVPTPAYGSLDEDNSVGNPVVLPKIGLAFDVFEGHTIAATVSRGYRAGFSEAVAGRADINEVDPEYLWAYELAYRSRWLNDRLQFNANGFYYDYRDQQVPTYNPAFPGQTIVRNAADSHAYGAEFELHYRPLEYVEVFGSLGLLHTEYDKAVVVVDNAEVDISGNAFPGAPAVTFTVGGIVKHHSGLYAAADVTFTDGFYSDDDLTNDRYVDSYTLVNAQLGYEYGPARISGYVRNLFNEEYLTSIGAGNTFATIGEGREFGLRGTLRF
nr:TonB-dependent receptor [Acuticoccus kalidii]